MNHLILALVSPVGMIVVSIVAVVYWRRVSAVAFRWLWVGAGLWTVAVALKVACALVCNKPLIGFLKENLSHELYVSIGALYLGVQSSLTEIGLTLAAVLLWRQLGRDANRAIGIGLGAGAFEAFLLGLGAGVAMLYALAGVPGTEAIGKEIETAAATTPLFWLCGPVERIIAILCHASSRALVLLGVANRRPMMVFWGFLLFTLLDGVAGALLISGKMGQFSLWWIELAVLPFGLISIPILRACYRRWGKREEKMSEETQGEVV